jgi:hypothetical protein
MGSAPHCMLRLIGSRTVTRSNKRLPLDVTIRILRCEKQSYFFFEFLSTLRAKSPVASRSKLTTQKITKGNLTQKSNNNETFEMKETNRRKTNE